MFGSGRTSSNDYVLRSLALKRQKKDELDVRRRLFRVSTTSLVGLVAVGIIVYMLVRGMQPQIAFEKALLAFGGAFQCREASSLIRNAIDYGQDPCEDFYAFACKKRGVKVAAEAQDVAAQTLQDILVALAKTNGDREDACRQVAFFYKSCLVANSSPLVDLRENAEALFSLVNKTLKQVRQVTTVVEIIEFAANLSLSHGVLSFVSLIFGSSGSLLLSFNNPFSRYSDENDLRRLLSKWVELLDFARNDTDIYVENLMTLDRELNDASHDRPYVQDVSLATLSNLMGRNVGPDELTRMLNSYRPSGLKPLTQDSTISIPGLKYTKRVFSILFETASVTEVMEYFLLHALLPQSLLQLAKPPSDDGACLDLTRRTFVEVWDDLATYLLLLGDRTGDARVIVTNLTVTLKKLLSQNLLFATSADVSVAVDKLNKIDVKFPKPAITRVEARLKGLGRMNASSLYKNILELGRFAVNRAAGDQSSSQTPAGSTNHRHRTLTISMEALKPPFYCHGEYKFLNYATFGAVSAEALLGALDGPFTEDRHNASLDYSHRTGAKLEDIKECLAHSVSRISADVAAPKTWLRHLVLSVGAFQLALEASLLGRVRDSRVDEVDEPAMDQTFFARYCQSVCADESGDSSAGRVPPNVRCNVAVMNSPRFSNLFKCVRDDQMTPSRQCSVL